MLSHSSADQHPHASFIFDDSFFNRPTTFNVPKKSSSVRFSSSHGVDAFESYDMLGYCDVHGVS